MSHDDFSSTYGVDLLRDDVLRRASTAAKNGAFCAAAVSSRRRFAALRLR